MYYINELLGKVVTLKTQKGEEFIGTLMGIDEDKTVLTIKNPKIVVIAGQDVALVPFALTAETETVFMQADQLLTVMKTIETSANDYLDMISAEEEIKRDLESADDTVTEESLEEV
jgi:hypothetical protein